MTLVWEQEDENSGGLWGLYDDGNFVGEVYALSDCFRWRDEVSNARRCTAGLSGALRGREGIHPVGVEIRIRAAAAMKLKSDAINSDRVNRHLGGRIGFMLV
jgi:hypothetical protein